MCAMFFSEEKACDGRMTDCLNVRLSGRDGGDEAGNGMCVCACKIDWKPDESVGKSGKKLRVESL